MKFLRTEYFISYLVFTYIVCERLSVMQSFPEVVETDWQWLMCFHRCRLWLKVTYFFSGMVCGDYVHESVYR